MANQRYTPAFSSDVTQEQQIYFRQLYGKLQDLADAHNELAAKTGDGGVTNITNVTNLTTGGGSTGSLAGLGKVNMQNVDYTLQNGDAGSLVVFTTPVATNCILNFNVTVPFFAFVQNFGPSVLTLLPDGGALVNGAASLPIQPNFYAIVFFDNLNWEAATLPLTTLALETDGTPNASQILLNLVAGSGITLTNSGGDVTIDSTGGGGAWAGSGSEWREDAMGNLECWGQATVLATSAKYGTVAVTFPQTFSSTTGLIVVCSPVDFPSGSITPLDCYPTSITTGGFTANLACSVPTGGGGDTIDNNVRVHYRAIGPA